MSPIVAKINIETGNTVLVIILFVLLSSRARKGERFRVCQLRRKFLARDIPMEAAKDGKLC